MLRSALSVAMWPCGDDIKRPGERGGGRGRKQQPKAGANNIAGMKFVSSSQLK